MNIVAQIVEILAIIIFLMSPHQNTKDISCFLYLTTLIVIEYKVLTLRVF